MAKPTRQSLLEFGVPPPVAAQPPLMIEKVNASAGLLFYRAHGLALDAPISLRLLTVTTLGAMPGALPGSLLEGATYYARPSTGDAFALASAPTPASAIASFTDAGVGRFSILWSPNAGLDASLDEAWDYVLSQCTAHGGDVEAPVVTNAARALAAQLYCARLAAGDPAKQASLDGLSSIWDKTYRPYLAALFQGAPVRGATDGTPGVADDAAKLVPLARGDFDLPGRHGEFRA